LAVAAVNLVVSITSIQVLLARLVSAADDVVASLAHEEIENVFFI